MKNLNKMKIAGDMQFEIGQDKVSHFPTWEVKDDKTLCKKVEDLKHSTFDKSKFTVVGSPTITDDGVASGFMGTSKLLTNFKPLDKPWEIQIEINPSIPSALTGFIAKNNIHCLNINQSPTNDISLYLSSDGVNWNIGNISIKITPNTINKIKVGWTGTQYYIDNGINRKTIDSTVPIFDNNELLNIGSNRAGNAPFNGSIDLKHFLITVDGKEVFSGNQTGVDQIKKNDYTKIGSPTITDDGIFSWNNKNDSVTYFSNNSLNTTNYEIRTRVIISNKTSLRIEDKGYTQFLHCYSRNTDVIQLYTEGTNKITIHGPGFSYTNLVSNALNYNIIDIVITNDGTLFTATAIDGETGLVISQKTSATSGSELALTTTNLSIAYNPFFMSATATYKVDLNCTKLYVDGNLIYQPTLHIPYTQSKTGSKIVDVAYRDRVQDLFEQVGYNGYFTLGENDFTLPTHKFSDVIDCYENGINKWEQRVDRTLRQQGSCTAGTEVALLKPYTDDESYALSVPYSAKTASSFIPTVTGDWFAEGKITL